MPILRTAVRVLLLAAASILVLVGRASAEEAPKCTCARKQATYDYLHAPVEMPDDVPHCPRQEATGKHDAPVVPKDWNGLCYRTDDMEAFLRRHAASWELTCSECLAEPKPCKFPNAHQCPGCGEPSHPDPFAKDPFRKDARTEVAAQLQQELKYFDEAAPVVVYSRHFYLVTDIPKVRVRKANGGLRWIKGHEYAHLMIQRAERAYRDFRDAFPGSVRLNRPMGIFLPEKESTARKLQGVYFRAPRTHMIYAAYASRAASAISDGFCLNGFCVSVERVKGSASARKNQGIWDYALHQSVRHMIGHLLVTCWTGINGEVRTMPRWAFVGTGHWLGKLHPRLEDDVYYCEGEDKRVKGSGAQWRKDLIKRAARDDFTPIEVLFGKQTLGGIEYRDHQQCWGYFDLSMAEWRKPFVAMLKAVRKEMPVRQAFAEHLGVTPEEFHTRWVERLLGKRETMAPIPADAADADAPPARSTLDPDAPAEELAAAIRGLGEISDPERVRELLDLLADAKDELVRETVFVALRKATGEPARSEIPRYGLIHGNRTVRAFAARLVRHMQLTGAREMLRINLGDGGWLVRAEAALASGATLDFDAQADIRAMLSDRAPKARIAAMDALTLYGEKVNRMCVPLVIPNLGHADWQVRLATCEALAKLRDHRAVGPLIERMDVESGRIREACYEALKELTHEDLGAKPDNWRRWWKTEEPRVRERGGFLPRTAGSKDADEKTPDDGRYAEQPTYYGIEIISDRVAYVLDVSRSTNRRFTPSSSSLPGLAAPLDGPTRTINEICRAEVAANIDRLAAHTRFNVITFGTRVATFEDKLVPATRRNKGAATRYVEAQAPLGETNMFGALKAALSLADDELSQPGFTGGPDTVTFLTDGEPTAGRITEKEALLAWFAERNRYARTRTHVIVFGTLGVDEPFLQKLARAGNGRFVQVLESRPK